MTALQQLIKIIKQKRKESEISNTLLKFVQFKAEILLKTEKEKQDDFAIGFAHFLAEHTYSCYENGWSNDFGHKELTTKELLEIYKKEKGL